jgi:hypothetical protein
VDQAFLLNLPGVIAAMRSPRDRQDLELFGPMYVASLPSPIGKIYVESDGERITRVSFTNPGRGRGGRTPNVLKEALVQLGA